MTKVDVSAKPFHAEATTSHTMHCEGKQVLWLLESIDTRIDVQLLCMSTSV